MSGLIPTTDLIVRREFVFNGVTFNFGDQFNVECPVRKIRSLYEKRLVWSRLEHNDYTKRQANAKKQSTRPTVPAAKKTIELPVEVSEKLTATMESVATKKTVFSPKKVKSFPVVPIHVAGTPV